MTRITDLVVGFPLLTLNETKTNSVKIHKTWKTVQINTQAPEVHFKVLLSNIRPKKPVFCLIKHENKSSSILCSFQNLGFTIKLFILSHSQ